MSVLDLIALLVTLAAVFTFINIHYLKLSATIGLMLLALIMSITILGVGTFVPEVKSLAGNILGKIDFKEVLLNIMLSFLLFAGALHVDIQKLKEEALPVGILAFGATLLSTFLVGAITFYLFPLLNLGFEIDFIYCLLFGALISPTDPIAVLAILKTTKISKNLSIKIEGESLFNDGIGVVVFLTILAIATGGGGEEISAAKVGLLFGQEVIGGIALGLGLGFLGYYLLVIIDNEHTELEVLVSLALVLVGSQVALAYHISGPLAMVVMGLIIGQGNSSETEEGIAGDYVITFWTLIDEALNAILFILIGLQMLVLADAFIEKPTLIVAGLLTIPAVLLCRFIGVSIPITLMKFFRSFEKGTIKILTWGGLRGGISVALALSLTDKSFEINSDITNLIIACTYACVLFSVLVQGMTIKNLIK
jgi:monovalent cation:H+ antiporter, CPA1 family